MSTRDSQWTPSLPDETVSGAFSLMGCLLTLNLFQQGHTTTPQRALVPRHFRVLPGTTELAVPSHYTYLHHALPLLHLDARVQGSPCALPNDEMNKDEAPHAQNLMMEPAGHLTSASDKMRSDDTWDESMWHKGALIGSGPVGQVYLGLHAETGALVAVKELAIPPAESASETDQRKRTMVESLRREMGTFISCKHENLVRHLGYSSSAEHFNIFLEYVPGGSVQNMLQSYGALAEPLTRSFALQVLNALAYLHSNELIHGNLKGTNVLVDNKGTVKVSDFGTTNRLSITATLGDSNDVPQDSVFWMAPEVVRQDAHTPKADVWSLGCVVVEMLTAKHPFPDCSPLQAIGILRSETPIPPLPEDASPEALQFLNQLFEMGPAVRPSAADLMPSPFLNC